MPDTPAFIGLDYSSKNVDIGIIRGRDVVLSKQYALGSSVRGQVAVMTRMVRELYDLVGPCSATMEEPWVRGDKGVRTAMQVHRRCYWAEALLTAAGFTVGLVAVPVWHAQILGDGRLSSGDGKLASMRVVQAMFKMRPETHNGADAICLAMWGQSQERLAMAGVR